MSGGALAGDAGWQDAEIARVSLPDQRLARRLRRLLDQLSCAPGQPLPSACGDWASTKAAYRFFDNPRITEHGVLAGHFAATATRYAASEGPILILQDTTEFIYGRAHPGKIGFTRIINGGRYQAGQPNVHTLCGVLMHSSLAVWLAGTPLGLTAAKNAIFYVLWTGCQWKALPQDLPPRSTVWEYLDLWEWDGTLARIHHVLYVEVREAAGREASPTTAIIDSQTGKSALKGGFARSVRLRRRQEGGRPQAPRPDRHDGPAPGRDRAPGRRPGS